MRKLLPGGFFELNPAKQAVYNEIKEIIKRSYKKYGYVNIETATVEANSTLLAKSGNEVSKQIFGLYGLKEGAKDLKPYSLRFDLTVPFARYILDNEECITFPFKRYQMQNVFRGEKQQAGRFKEFTQCDIDIIGNNLPINYDIETIKVLYKTLQEIFEYLEIKKSLVVKINSRIFIDAICEKFSIQDDKRIAFFTLLDSFYKLDEKEFNAQLLQIVGDESEKIKNILSSDITNLKGFDGISDLGNMVSSLKKSQVNVVFAPYITRGLEYYSGVVFETFIAGNTEFGSICSGGRYDNLVGNIKTDLKIDYNGVGGSIGLSRLFSRLDEEGYITKKLPLADVMIFNVSGGEGEYKESIAEIFQEKGFGVDLYYAEDSLKKQFKYALSRDISYGVFIGGAEMKKKSLIIKDFATKEEKTILFDELEKILENFSF